jgi:hypothetical protein
MVKVHVDRFSFLDIALDMEVIGKLLAIKSSLAGKYTTDELPNLFSDLIFGVPKLLMAKSQSPEARAKRPGANHQ